MSAWSSSPYRAVNIYIGGINRGCSQPALTAGWVTKELGAGWGLFPTYVGLQAPGNSCGCSAIQPSQATAEGTAAAADAVSKEQALGIGAGPVYFDMEGYNHGGSTTTAVLTFLAAWTTKLHADGYLSGVYSSAGSGIVDLVSKYGTGYAEPDDIWIADWNGQKTTNDPAVPSADWPNHQRIHQYSGGRNETYGGITINVDDNYLDGAVVLGSGSVGAPTGVMARAGDRSAVVSWKAPASGGGSVTGYLVSASPGKHSAVVPASATSTVVIGMTDGTPCTFTVTALTAAGAGPASAPSSAVTPAKAASLPGQPRGASAAAANAGARVTWTAPPAKGGAAVSDYFVTASPGGVTTEVAAPSLSATLTGLSNGTTYTFKVTALSANGAGPPSKASNAATP